MRINQWLIKAIAHQLNNAFTDIWKQRQAASPGKPVDFLDLLNTLAPLLPALEAQIILNLDQRLETAWTQLLQDFPEHPEVHLCNADIERLITLLNADMDVTGFEVFGSDYHSPDIMISSASMKAFNHGDYEIIVGEVHPAVHTLSQPVAAPFGPFNTQINQQVEAIFPTTASDTGGFTHQLSTFAHRLAVAIFLLAIGAAIGWRLCRGESAVCCR